MEAMVPNIRKQNVSKEPVSKQEKNNPFFLQKKQALPNTQRLYMQKKLESKQAPPIAQ